MSSNYIVTDMPFTVSGLILSLFFQGTMHFNKDLDPAML